MPKKVSSSKPGSPAGLNRRKFLRSCLALAAAGVLPGKLLAAPSGGAYDAVIVGGGLSGLSAALKLKDKNILLLEKSSALGGRVIEGQWEGFHYAQGAEYIGPPEDDVAALFKELGLVPTAVTPPADAVARKGKIHAGYDYLGFLENEAQRKDYWRLVRLLEAYNTENIGGSGSGGREFLTKDAALDGISMKQWMRQNKIDPLVQELIEVENRGIFGASSGDLSFYFDVQEMAWNMTYPEDADESEVYSFPKGMYEVITALQSALGQRVVTGAKVLEVRADNGGVSVSYTSGGSMHAVQARCAVLTAPAPLTAGMVKSWFSDAVMQTLADIPYAAYATLNLFLKERPWREAWAASCLGEYFVTIYDAVRLQVRPDYDGKSVLGVYLAPVDKDDQYLLNAPEEEILSKTMEGLAKYFPNIQSLLMGHDFYRFRYAFPVFHPGYLQVLDRLKNDGTVKGPLFLAGDYMSYATIDGAVHSGYRAARRAKAWLTSQAA